MHAGFIYIVTSLFMKTVDILFKESSYVYRHMYNKIHIQKIPLYVASNRGVISPQIPYSTITWHGKILANLANRLPFANILPISIFLPTYVVSLLLNPNSPNFSPPISGVKPICQYFPLPHNCAIWYILCTYF